MYSHLASTMRRTRMMHRNTRRTRQEPAEQKSPHLGARAPPRPAPVHTSVFDVIRRAIGKYLHAS